MTISRFVWQADEKIKAICALLYHHGELPKADRKSLAYKAGISPTTLASAIKERFSADVEEKLAAVARFDVGHPSWIDEAVPEHARRDKSYTGKDSAESFRAHLAKGWSSAAVNFRTERSEFKAFDPHMAKHHISDGQQATQAGNSMQLFLAAQFQPFLHHSGIKFGFRKVALLVEIHAGSARAVECLGYPTEASLGKAIIRGESESPLQRWVIEQEGGPSEMLSGEYATKERPLMCLTGCQDGTTFTSQIDVNIYDRTSFVNEGSLDLSANKQELIEQIFLRELPAAIERNGWVTVSSEKVVVGRYSG